MLIKRSILFEGNTAGTQGGGFALFNETTTKLYYVNSYFADNSAETGGAISIISTQ